MNPNPPRLFGHCEGERRSTRRTRGATCPPTREFGSDALSVPHPNESLQSPHYYSPPESPIPRHRSSPKPVLHTVSRTRAQPLPTRAATAASAGRPTRSFAPPACGVAVRNTTWPPLPHSHAVPPQSRATPPQLPDACATSRPAVPRRAQQQRVGDVVLLRQRRVRPRDLPLCRPRD